MKRILYTIITIGIPFLLKAQLVDVEEKTSGFFGKRFMIGMNGLVGFSSEPQQAVSEADLPRFSLNKNVDLSIFYTLNNRYCLGIKTGTSRTSVNFDHYSMLEDYYGAIHIDEDGNNYFVDEIKNSPSIRDKYISLELRQYRALKGAFSPLGAHLTYGISLHRYDVDISNVQINTYARDMYGSSIESRPFTNSTPLSYKTIPEFYMGYGYSAPIFKHFIYNIGIKSGFLFTGILTTESDTFDQEMENAVYFRLLKKEIINYNFGLHYAF